MLGQQITALKQEDYKTVFRAVQDTPLMAPSTRSVLTVGEESLSKSIQRIGEIDFFSVVTRRPKICDFKPVVVEVALARFLDRGREDTPIQLLRFANRVPLQFDKGGCAITKAIESVNWRSYGLAQPKGSLPQGPYIFAVSVVSPFIKFKNASKETIDASDELVEEIRLALMRAGQKLSRHIRKEAKAADLERKIQHIEQFGPILVEGLARLVKASNARVKRAEDGLKKILGRDTDDAEQALEKAETRLAELKKKQSAVLGSEGEEGELEDAIEAATEAPKAKAKTKKKAAKKATKKVAKKAPAKKAPAKKKTAKKVAKKAPTKKAPLKKTSSKKKAAKKVTKKTAKKAAKKTKKKR